MEAIALVIFGIVAFCLTIYLEFKKNNNEKEIIEKMLETYNIELKNGITKENSAVYYKIKSYII